MADAGRAVTDLGGADRVLTFPHALDEVSHVVVGAVQPYCVCGQRVFQDRFVAGLDSVAADKYPACLTLETNPVFALIRRQYGDAIRVGIGHIEFGGDIIGVWLIRRKSAA